MVGTAAVVAGLAVGAVLLAPDDNGNPHIGAPPSGTTTITTVPTTSAPARRLPATPSGADLAVPGGARRSATFTVTGQEKQKGALGDATPPRGQDRIRERLHRGHPHLMRPHRRLRPGRRNRRQVRREPHVSRRRPRRPHVRRATAAGRLQADHRRHTAPIRRTRLRGRLPGRGRDLALRPPQQPARPQGPAGTPQFADRPPLTLDQTGRDRR